MKNPISLDKLLNSENHELASLITRARQLAKYNAWLKSHLPSPLNEYCAIADTRDEQLVLSVDNAIWATKLRFIGISVLSQMKVAFPELSRLEQLKVIVLPRSPGTETVPVFKPPPHLSAENASVIRMLADSITDMNLRAALERLANHEEK